MSREYLDIVAEQLYYNQNNGAFKDQQDLFSIQDYKNLARPVLDLLHTRLSLNEIRLQLRKNSSVEWLVKKMVHLTKTVPGLVCVYGTDHYQETIIAGNRREILYNSIGKINKNSQPMGGLTIFDLDEVSKLFTCLSVLKLIEQNQISFNTKVKDICPEFKNLNGITVYDLLSSDMK